MSNTNRYLAVYAGLLTLAFASVVLTSGAGLRQQKLDVLDVQRINVREPDGTLRAVISNRAMLPGLIVKGKEYPHEREQAALIFYNDEGTENGGLGSGGAQGRSEGSLSFDAYEQDQIVTLMGRTDGQTSQAGLVIGDRPTRPILQDLKELNKLQAMKPADLDKLMQERGRAGYYGQERLFIGKAENEASINLSDQNGVPRLRLNVTAAGRATIDFLDQAGKVTRSLTSEGK